MTKRPHRPREPAPGECCGSGCARCVWDVYYDKLAKYELDIKKLQEQQLEEEQNRKNLQQELNEEVDSQNFNTENEIEDSDSECESSFCSDDDCNNNNEDDYSYNNNEEENECDYTGSVVVKYIDRPTNITEAMVEEEIKQSDLLKEFVAVYSLRLKQPTGPVTLLCDTIDYTHPSQEREEEEELLESEELEEQYQQQKLSNCRSSHLQNKLKFYDCTNVEKQETERCDIQIDNNENKNNTTISVLELELPVIANSSTAPFMPGDVIEVFVPNNNRNNNSLEHHYNDNISNAADERPEESYCVVNEVCKLMHLDPNAWCELRRCPFVPENHFPPWLPERRAMTIRLLLTYYVDLSSSGYLLRPNFLQNLLRIYELHHECKQQQEQQEESEREKRLSADECNNANAFKIEELLPSTSTTYNTAINREHEKQHYELQTEFEQQREYYESPSLEVENNNRNDENHEIEVATPFLLRSLVMCDAPAELSRLLNNAFHPLCYPTLTDMLRVFQFVQLPLSRLCELSGPVRPRKFSVVREERYNNNNNLNNSNSKNSKTAATDNLEQCIIELCVREICATIPQPSDYATSNNLQNTATATFTTTNSNNNNNSCYDMEYKSEYVNNRSVMSAEQLAHTLARLLNISVLASHKQQQQQLQQQQQCKSSLQNRQAMETERKLGKIMCNRNNKSCKSHHHYCGNGNDGVNKTCCGNEYSTCKLPMFHGHVSHPLCQLSRINACMTSAKQQQTYEQSINSTKVVSLPESQSESSSSPILYTKMEEPYKMSTIGNHWRILPHIYISRRLYGTSLFAQQLDHAIHSLPCNYSYSRCKLPKLLLIGAGTGIAPMMAAIHTLRKRAHERNKHHDSVITAATITNLALSNTTTTTTNNNNNDNKFCHSNKAVEIDERGNSYTYPCWVFYGARTPEELVYHKEFMNAQHEGLISTYEWALSRARPKIDKQHENKYSNLQSLSKECSLECIAEHSVDNNISNDCQEMLSHANKHDNCIHVKETKNDRNVVVVVATTATHNTTTATSKITSALQSPIRYVTELMMNHADAIRTSLLEDDGQMFVCGPAQMLQACRDLLLHSSLLKENNNISSSNNNNNNNKNNNNSNVSEDDGSVMDQRLRFLEARHQINYDVWSSVDIFST